MRKIKSPKRLLGDLLGGMWRLFKSSIMAGGEVGNDCWVDGSGDELLTGYFKSNSTGSPDEDI